MPSTTSSWVSRLLASLDGDDALLSHLLHRLGDQVADGAVAVSRHDAHLGDFGLALGRLGELLQLLDDRRDGPVDAPLETHRVVDRKSTRLNSSHSSISYAVF